MTVESDRVNPALREKMSIPPSLHTAPLGPFSVGSGADRFRGRRSLAQLYLSFLLAFAASSFPCSAEPSRSEDATDKIGIGVLLGNDAPPKDVLLGNDAPSKYVPALRGHSPSPRLSPQPPLQALRKPTLRRYNLTSDPGIYTIHTATETRVLWLLRRMTCGLIALTTFGIVVAMVGGAAPAGPAWDPNGSVPYRRWVSEVQAWLTATANRMPPAQQAAAIQLGLRSLAREFALTIPPAVIAYGATIEGVPTDPVTYLLYVLGNRFEALEDERALASGTQILDFLAHFCLGFP